MIARLLISLFLTTFSMKTFAENQVACMSHGDCQAVYGTQNGTKCFIVKTGQDSLGNLTCTLRCYSVQLGSSCLEVEGSAYGLCKREQFDMPMFDPADPNRCDSAIDPL
jgi:hypothetical protein